LDAARQVVRWSIPATVFVLALLGGELWFAWFFLGAPDKVRLAQDINAAATLIVIVLGLGLGFVLFQIYFYAFDSVLPWCPHVIGVPPDRGREVLAALDDRQLGYVRATTGIRFRLHDMLGTHRLHPLAGVRLPHDSRKRRIVYRARRDTNWRTVRRLILEYIAPNEMALVEYQRLTDTYHGLGTCRVATLFAGITFGTYNLRVHYGALSASDPVVASRLIVAVVGAALFYVSMYLLFGRARRGTAMTLQHDLIDALRAAVPRALDASDSAAEVSGDTADRKLSRQIPGSTTLARASRPARRPRRPALHPHWWVDR